MRSIIPFVEGKPPVLERAPKDSMAQTRAIVKTYVRRRRLAGKRDFERYQKLRADDRGRDKGSFAPLLRTGLAILLDQMWRVTFCRAVLDQRRGGSGLESSRRVIAATVI
jgi:hypothetical protein